MKHGKIVNNGGFTIFQPGEVYCMMSDGASDLLEIFGVSRQKNLGEKRPRRKGRRQ